MENNRARHIAGTNHKQSSLEVGLYDMDSAIKFYFDNKIMPRVFTKSGAPMKVPVVYGSPERWKSTQKSSFYRDKDGKVQIPLIMYKRSGLTRQPGMSSKIDPDKPLIDYVENKYSKENIYDSFSRTYGTSRMKEFSKLVVPDFVTLTYDCIIWTDYLQEMNKIMEAVTYAAGAYWGDTNKFTFKSKVASFNNTTEVEMGNDRIIRSSFNIELDGYIIADNIQKAMAMGSKTTFGPSTIQIGLETVVDIENIPWINKY